MSKPIDTSEDLFGWNTPRPADTSMDAFKAIKHRLGGVHQKILYFIAKRGPIGGTLDECCQATGILVQTASARFRELVQWGEIEDTGQRRPTRTKNMARVYRIKANNGHFLVITASIVPGGQGQSAMSCHDEAGADLGEL